uniref:Uncharacterized protein n=1 Tax=Manihot esculenta TaxID=3983 RepID=A0A2C9VPA0_MANES
MPEEYWKSVMKEQTMLDGIRNMFVKDSAADNNFVSDYKSRYHFVKDFDIKCIPIINESSHRENLRVDDHEKKQKKISAERNKPETA